MAVILLCVDQKYDYCRFFSKGLSMYSTCVVFGIILYYIGRESLNLLFT